MVVTDANELSVTSDRAWLRVMTPPVITVQPQDQVGDVGGTNTFSVSATGLQLSYQWQRNGVDVPGATTSTLTLNDLEAIQAGNYTAVVSNPAGSVTSRVATLTLFTKITEEPAINDDGHSWTSAWGDYDNNGYIDLFIARDSGYYTHPAIAQAYLYRNNDGGSFTRMTGPEVGPIATDLTASVCGAWGDYDNDGHLDIYVGGFAIMDGANYLGLPNVLYRNEGDGTFSRQDEAGPIVTDAKITLGVSWADYDNDGYLDMFAADARNNIWFPGHTSVNSLYHNNRNGTFGRDDAAGLSAHYAEASMSAWADYDDDGDMDVVVACGQPYPSSLLFYKNNGDGTFARVTDGPITLCCSYFVNATAWGDYDNDGRLDLVVVPGNGPSGWASPCYLFHNEGGDTFTQHQVQPWHRQ